MSSDQYSATLNEHPGNEALDPTFSISPVLRLRPLLKLTKKWIMRYTPIWGILRYLRAVLERGLKIRHELAEGNVESFRNREPGRDAPVSGSELQVDHARAAQPRCLGQGFVSKTQLSPPPRERLSKSLVIGSW